MYKESYISDGPEGKTCYDFVLDAEYKIINGKRVYQPHCHELRTVPPDDDPFFMQAVRCVSVVLFIFLATILTGLYLIHRLIHI